MKVLATYPDVEVATKDLLRDLLDDLTGETATVGVVLPADWVAKTSPPHLEVACDGTPILEHPIAARSTIRVTAWSNARSEAKRLATLALGLLAAHDGSGDISAIQPLTGVLPARDPANRGELASVTLRVTVRSTPI